MSRVDDFCTKLTIRILPCAKARFGERKPRCTFARQAIRKLMAKHGEGHAAFVLKTIVDTGRNATELFGDTISAVSDVMLARPEWPERGLAWMDAFDGIDLGDLREKAKAWHVAPVRETMAALIAAEVERRLAAPEKVETFHHSEAGESSPQLLSLAA
jgi:hypothetical protein